MDELKRSVNAVKLELDEELKKINGVSAKLDKNLSLIDDVREEQKHVFTAHKQELDSMEECVKHCQIQIAQHDERLKAYETNSTRQNGNLDKLSDNIGDVAHSVNEIVKKVDAMDTSIANRMNEIERNGIKRESSADIDTRDREAAWVKSSDARTDADRTTAAGAVDDLRSEWLRSRITFNWKLIGALGSLAFLFILVFISYSFHVFGGLP